MITQDMIPQLVGRAAYDRDGKKIGQVGQVYVDDQDGAPRWATVNTGLFGSSESFVPLASAALKDRDLTLAVSKAQVKDAPHVDPVQDHLGVEQQDRLDRYYGVIAGARGDRDRADTDELSAVDRDRDGAMTRSEERLHVDTERYETGRARLRKFVVTEEQRVTVPVSHEEVRMVREPIRDGSVGPNGGGTATIGEDVQEVTLHAERPVVDKRVEAVERVGLSTETVTEDATVSEKIRKEQIDFDDARDGRGRTS